MYYDRHNNVTVAQRNFVCAKIKISIKIFLRLKLFYFFVDYFSGCKKTFWHGFSIFECLAVEPNKYFATNLA